MRAAVNIVICDDERAETQYLAELVRRWAGERGVTARVSAYGSAESFLFEREDGPAADIMLLDIQMKELDGVELARRIRREPSGSAVQIVFITGLPDFIAEGYDVAALHYLMKPVSEAKIFEVLGRALERLERTGASVRPVYHHRKFAGQRRRGACAKLPNETDRFIRVYIDTLKDQLYISVSNAAVGVKKPGKAYISTKEAPGHGFGLMRVDKIAEKYGGFVNRQSEEGIFATEIMLPI